MSSLLEVKDLTKHFLIRGGIFSQVTGKVQAVTNVSFNLAKQETLGIVGESGCGKSTLGRTLLRLYEPTSGDIIFKGQSLGKLSKEQMRLTRRHIQMVFQDPFASLNPRRTIGQTLKEPMIVHGIGTNQEQEKRVSQLLDQVSLPQDSINRYPHEFSGGQRQRIGIARAICLKPDLIIADEPVSALDVSVQSQILNLFKDLQNQMGMSYVFISHNLAVIHHVSDWIGVMYLGRIVELARADSLTTAPLHPYTKALMASVWEPAIDLKSRTSSVPLVQGDPPSPLNPPTGCPFHPRCSMATDTCRKVNPDLVVKKEEHQVACHYV